MVWNTQSFHLLGWILVSMFTEWKREFRQKHLMYTLCRTFLVCLILTLVLLHFNFIYFNWKKIILQYCGGFCHTSIWITLGCTCVPASWTPHLTPLGCPRALALSALLHASNLHWPAILRMVIYVHVSMLFSNTTPPSPSPT